MLFFHREVARNANKNVGRINHFFGGRYKWCVINSDQYYWNAVKYVFRNPVAADICERVEEYKYSSLNSPSDLVHWSKIDFFANRSEAAKLNLAWLNEDFPEDQGKAIAKALRRREFKLPVNKSGRHMFLDTMQRKKGTGTSLTHLDEAATTSS